MDSAYQPSETLETIAFLLPATFYADRPLTDRVMLMVKAWNAATNGCVNLQRDLDYLRESLAANKRPFSDKFSAETIEGQVKTIQRLEKRCAELAHEVSNLRDDLSTTGVNDLLGATITSQRDRIRELEPLANKYREIEMLLSRRKALDGFATTGEKIGAMLHMCKDADPSGELTEQAASVHPSRFPQEVIERIMAASDIVEVIGGYIPLTRSGAMYRACCPFHKEVAPSFHVSPIRHIFKCYGCGAGGSVIQFVMQYDKIDFNDALRKLAEKANITLVDL